MRIEHDENVAPPDGLTLAEGIEKLALRITARDTDLDLSALTRILLTGDLADAARRLGAPPMPGDHLTRVVAEGAGFTLIVDGVKALDLFNGGVAELTRVIHHLHKDLWRIHDAARPDRKSVV